MQLLHAINCTCKHGFSCFRRLQQHLTTSLEANSTITEQNNLVVESTNIRVNSYLLHSSKEENVKIRNASITDIEKT